MPTVYPLITEKQTFWINGAVASGAKMFVYLAGTTTKATVYTEMTGLSTSSNPVVLDSRGETPYGIYVVGGSSYKLVFAPSTDTDPPSAAIWTRDNLDPVNDTTVTVDEWQASGFTPTYVSATSFTVTGDRTASFNVGRRLKSTNTGGTIYSTITASAYSSVTTVTVVNDSGTLDSGLSSVSWGLQSATNPSEPLLSDVYPIRSGSADKTKKLRIEVDGFTTGTTRVLTPKDKDYVIGDLYDNHGQCRLAKVSANLVLSPFDGNRILINSGVETIPDAGVSLAPSGLSTNTLYYIYAYMSGSTMTLEASTTAYAIQTGTGVYTKSGDVTRTLVGMERATGATTWQGLCRSWFHDPGYTAVGAFSTNRTESTSTFTEINSEIQTGFLVWTNEIVNISAQGAMTNSGTGLYWCALTLDGTTTANSYNAGGGTAGQVVAFGQTRYASGLSEGYHYATLVNKVAGGGTVTYYGGAASTNERCTIAVYCKR